MYVVWPFVSHKYQIVYSLHIYVPRRKCAIEMVRMLLFGEVVVLKYHCGIVCNHHKWILWMQLKPFFGTDLDGHSVMDSKCIVCADKLL